MAMDHYRLFVEREILAREMPQYAWHDQGNPVYVLGWQYTSARLARFQLRLDLPRGYPDACPNLFVMSPRILRTHDGGAVNDYECSHVFHTRLTGHGGCVQICHTGFWDASKTCFAALLRGVLWLEAYEAHLATGRRLADFMTGSYARFPAGGTPVSGHNVLDIAGLDSSTFYSPERRERGGPLDNGPDPDEFPPPPGTRGTRWRSYPLECPDEDRFGR
jgi:hypothetical protein